MHYKQEKSLWYITQFCHHYTTKKSPLSCMKKVLLSSLKYNEFLTFYCCPYLLFTFTCKQESLLQVKPMKKATISDWGSSWEFHDKIMFKAELLLLTLKELNKDMKSRGSHKKHSAILYCLLCILNKRAVKWNQTLQQRISSSLPENWTACIKLL